MDPNIPPPPDPNVVPAESARPVSHGARLRIDAGRLWAGGVATALVAALVAIVGVLVCSVALDTKPIAPSWLLGDSENATISTRFAITAAVAALLATALLHLLLLSTPRPIVFFGWIVALATVAAAVSPFTIGNDTERQVACAVIIGCIGLVIGTSLAAVAGRTTRYEVT